MGIRGLKTNLKLSLLANCHSLALCFTFCAACDQDPAFKTLPTQGDSESRKITSENAEAENQAATKEVCDENHIAPSECNQYSLYAQELQVPEPRGVDILWIVDNSASMSQEQTYLGQNFSKFIDAFTQTHQDFQMAVTSTDSCQDEMPTALEERRCPVQSGTNHLRGTFVGAAGNSVLTPSTPDLGSRFRNYVNIGTSGSGFEHGLTSAFLGLDKSLNGENDSLVRKDAFLSVILVSDEEDDGIGLSQPDGFSGTDYWSQGMTRYRYTDEDFINYLTSIKGKGQFSISAIVGTLDQATGKACTAPHTANTEIGTQYIAAANKTGGLVQSICALNWDDSLTKLGSDIASQVSQITLDKKPVEESIKVIVDGETSNNWTYIEATNTIRFDSTHLPGAGAKLRIEYLTE